MATLDGPIDSVTLSDVGGHVDALGVLTLTDASGEVRDDVEWGIDENTDAAIQTTAANLVVTGYAGTFDTDHIEATVSPDWVAVCATPELTHVGRYKVKARCTCPTTATQVRLVWHSGEAPYTTNPIAVAHRADEAIELDLGVVNIVEQEGTHAWTGRVEVKGDTIDAFQITDLLYIPADRYGRARGANLIFAASTPLVAADNFDSQPDGSLIGTTADLGGAWSESGDADDFEISAAFGVAYRDAVSDASSFNGQYARLGSATPAYVDVSVDISRSGLVALVSFSGIFLRYTDINNWLLATYTSVGPDVRIHLRKRVAGVVTTLDEANMAPGAGGFRTLRVVADSDGNVVVLDGPTGAQLESRVVVLADADLATGGALDDGGFGIYDENTTATVGSRTFNNFAVHSAAGGAPIFDHVINPGQSMQLDHRSAQRENADGTRWGDVPVYSGRRLLVPPATRNGNTSRLVIKQDRNDLTQLPVGDPSAVNLCTNPSAVTDTTGWTNSGLVTFERVTSLPTLFGLPSGVTTGFHGVGNASNDNVYDEIAVETGQAYRFSAYVYLDSATAVGIALFVRDPTPGSLKAQGATFSTLDAWTRIEVEVTADETDTWRFRFDQIGGGGADFYFTAVEIRELDQLSAALTVTPRVLLTS